MANPLFQNQANNSKNPLADMINSLKTQGPSEAVFNSMYNNNPQFREFANTVRGKTPEEAFSQYGLDFNQFRNQRW